MHLGKIRTQIQRLAIMFNRLVRQAERLERIAKIVMCFCIARIEGQGLSEMICRFLMPVEALQCVADVVMHGCFAKPELQGFLIVLNRIVVAGKASQSDRKTVMCFRRPLIGLNGAAKQGLCVGETRLLKPEKAEMIKRAKMASVFLEDSLIELLGARSRAVSMG